MWNVENIVLNVFRNSSKNDFTESQYGKYNLYFSVIPFFTVEVQLSNKQK